MVISCLMLESFIQFAPQSCREYQEIKPGENIKFMHGVCDYRNKFILSIHTRGSYDMTSFRIMSDSLGLITFGKARKAKGMHQNELMLYHSKGSYTLQDNRFNITAQTPFEKFYLLEISKKGIVDSFYKKVELSFRPLMLNGNNTKVFTNCDEEHNYILALPENVATDQIHKPFHSKKSIGVFSDFFITDSLGKKRFLPQGDYILTGGNRLVRDENFKEPW
ncbi:MAG: hypothetical protein WCU83_11775 [Bacteroidia bacterium]|jgi:hypothetical protein